MNVGVFISVAGNLEILCILKEKLYEGHSYRRAMGILLVISVDLLVVNAEEHEEYLSQ